MLRHQPSACVTRIAQYLHFLRILFASKERLLRDQATRDSAASLLLSSSDVSVALPPPVVPSSPQDAVTAPLSVVTLVTAPLSVATLPASSGLIYQAVSVHQDPPAGASCAAISLLADLPTLAMLPPVAILMSPNVIDSLHAPSLNALISPASPTAFFLYTWIRVRKKLHIIIYNYIFTFETSPSPPYALGCLEVALFMSGPSSTGVGNPLQSGVINYLKYEQCCAAHVKALTHTIYSIYCTTLIINSIALHLLYYHYTTHLFISGVAHILSKYISTNTSQPCHTSCSYTTLISITPLYTTLSIIHLLSYQTFKSVVNKLWKVYTIRTNISALYTYNPTITL
jgi:hypothetical protein